MLIPLKKLKTSFVELHKFIYYMFIFGGFLSEHDAISNKKKKME